MIKTEGLINPLIVVDATVGIAWDKKKQHGKQLREPPGDGNPEVSDPPHDKQLYVIWGGSNRYAVLQDMGCTHVDCIIIKDFKVAFKIQATQRNSHKELHRLTK
jgi:hypothetical protein